MQLLTGLLAVLWLTPPALVQTLGGQSLASAVTMSSPAVIVVVETPRTKESVRIAAPPSLSMLSRSPNSHRIARDEVWTRRSAVDRVRREVASVAGQRGRKRRGQFNQLTRREQEIIRLLIQGVSNKEIAQQLLISERTVKGHLTHVYSKLGVSSRLQLAVSTFQTNTKVL